MELKDIVGFVARFGTTSAAMANFIAVLWPRSSEGIRPRIAAINGTFQLARRTRMSHWSAVGGLALAALSAACSQNIVRRMFPARASSRRARSPRFRVARAGRSAKSRAVRPA